MIEKYEIIKECCEGYDVSPDGTHCRPVCDEPCVQGTCISPNVCKCDRYYEGPTCNIRIGGYFENDNVVVKRIYFHLFANFSNSLSFGDVRI